MKKIIIFLALVFMPTLLQMPFVAAAKTAEAVYNDETSKMVLNVDGLSGKGEAAIAMFDTDNPDMPVYFAQVAVNENGAINYSYVFHMPNGKECEDYLIKINASSSEIISITPKSIYDKKYKIHIDDLKYLPSNGEWLPLNEENISHLYGQNVNVAFDITGKGASSLGATIAVALKVGDRLHYVDVLYNDDISFEQTVPLEFETEFPEDCRLEIYAWEDFESIKPLRPLFVVANEEKTILSLANTNEKIYTNPGKGFLRYGSSFSGNQADGITEYASAGYWRFSWADIEPSEGNYNWSLIDNEISYWKQRGKGFAFGVMCANSASYVNYITPKWVFDAGAQYTQSTLANGTVQYTPVWNDEVFLSKLTEFVKALAKRYDGNDSIEFIDIRSCGNYGEMHVGNLNSTFLPATTIKAHIDIYSNAFENTNLMMCVNKRGDMGEITKYAVSKGVGLRNDGMANNAENPLLTLDAKHKAPVAFELAASYQTLKNNAANANQDNLNRLWNRQSYLRAIELATPNYMDLGQYGNDPDVFIADNEDIVKDIADKLGYKFALKNIKLPHILEAGRSYGITTAWENTGISYLYNDCNIAIAVIDANENVLAYSWLDGTDANSFVPGCVTVCDDTFRIESVANGSYTLSVGLFKSKTGQSPDFKICNVGRFGGGWYPVADIVFSGGKYTVSAMDDISEEIVNIPSYPGPSEYTPDGELIADYSITSESDFSWTGKNGSNADFFSSTSAYSGTYCGRISFRNGTLYGAQVDITERLRANGPGTYKMSGYFKADAGTGISIYLGYMNAGATTKSTAFSSVNTSWKKLEQTVTFTSEDINNMAQMSLLITGRDGTYAGSTTANIYFDDVRITKIN
ncbi:MAG: DUF4832 domain-containing protein [Clostridia bacterium]|nr:DUF4832 domain-containing protein [Clostridia bacterium]